MRSARTSLGIAALALFLLLGPVSLVGSGAAAAAERCTVGVCIPDSSPEPAPAPEPAPEPAPTATEPAPAPAPSPEAQSQPKPAPESESDPTGALLRLLNRERHDRGLPALVERADVDQVAAGWSNHLADVGTLSHNDEYFSPATRQRLGGRALGENVAYNQSIEAAHTALMNSPHHRDNILDARFSVVGLGAIARNGTWWITEDFLQPAPGTTARSGPAAPAKGHTTIRPTTPAVATTHASAGAAATVPLPAPPAATAPDPSPASSSFLITPTPPQPASAATGVSPVSGPAAARAASIAIAGMTCIGAAWKRRRRDDGLRESEG